MPKHDLLFGLFGLSYYESDFIVQHRLLKKEMSDYKDFLYSLKSKWNDKKNEEFFRKHINNTVEDADSYLFNCEKLIMYIEEARKLKEI